MESVKTAQRKIVVYASFASKFMFLGESDNQQNLIIDYNLYCIVATIIVCGHLCIYACIM